MALSWQVQFDDSVRTRTPIYVGLAVAGVGVTLGERSARDGSRTSALGFGSDSPLSPILEGRGYWRYVPTDDGIRFLTGYDYTPRWGLVGELVVRGAARSVPKSHDTSATIRSSGGYAVIVVVDVIRGRALR